MQAFNTVTGGQFSAHLKAYAYETTTRELTNSYSGEVKTVTVHYLYHLDIVGSDATTVDAIMSGLVNEPNSTPVKFFYQASASPDPASDENSLLMWAAPKAYIGTRKIYGMPLKHSKGFQAMLSCEAALPLLPEANRRQKEHHDGAARQEARLPYFVILLPDEIPQLQTYPLDQLYLERLNREVSNPFLPEWSAWLLNWAQTNGYIKPLTSFGCVAHLCRVPDEAELAQAIEDAICSGEVYTGPTLETAPALESAVAAPVELALPANDVVQPPRLIELLPPTPLERAG